MQQLLKQEEAKHRTFLFTTFTYDLNPKNERKGKKKKMKENKKEGGGGGGKAISQPSHLVAHLVRGL